MRPPLPPGQNSNRNFIFGNTIRHSTYSGIAVYSLDEGPVELNVIGANNVTDCVKWGITSGGYGQEHHDYALRSVFVKNTARGNGGATSTQGDFRLRGQELHDYFVSNDAELWINDPANATVASVFEHGGPVRSARNSKDSK